MMSQHAPYISTCFASLCTGRVSQVMLCVALTMYHHVFLVIFFTFLGVCRNIFKTNDVRTGLKKPEQESKKRAPSVEAAQLADAAQGADAAAADREPGTSGQAATLASAAAAAEWDAANAARQR